MADLRPTRTFSLGKVRNLWRNAGTALRDARAPAEFVSAPRRFDAAYDCGLSCALLLLECSKLELTGLGHHTEAFDFLVKTLKLRGQVAAAATAMVKARNSIRYDAEPIIDEAAVASAIEWADRILAETEG
ncbi:MAG TPA: hypothetical protein VJO99_03725, partial [Burkholderiaceae bacterium]|nr:hypothetical protein [Burkholderiaceae bacterium]